MKMVLVPKVFSQLAEIAGMGDQNLVEMIKNVANGEDSGQKSISATEEIFEEETKVDEDEEKGEEMTEA